jgi:Uma2 family endonuclease
MVRHRATRTRTLRSSSRSCWALQRAPQGCFRPCTSSIWALPSTTSGCPTAACTARQWGTSEHTAPLVVEIVSLGDEMWDRLPFYAAHRVDELLIVDPQQRSVSWLALQEGEYRPVERSRLIELGTGDLN